MELENNLGSKNLRKGGNTAQPYAQRVDFEDKCGCSEPVNALDTLPMDAAAEMPQLLQTTSFFGT